MGKPLRCKRARHASRENAIVAAKQTQSQWKNRGYHYNVYLCPHCGQWHIGRAKWSYARRIQALIDEVQ